MNPPKFLLHHVPNAGHSSFIKKPLYFTEGDFETKESEDLFEKVMLLPEKLRVVIHLFYYEDYSVKEIARILRISESNVKVRLNRGRESLKDILKEE